MTGARVLMIGIIVGFVMGLYLIEEILERIEVKRRR
jgi:hypothetical protein